MLNKFLFNKGTDLEVEIFTPHKFLLDIEETKPKLAKHYIPSWWKNMPRQISDNGTKTGTARTCPSFIQMFNQGIVIPMWTDTVLSHDDVQHYWITSNNLFSWDFHLDWQFLDYVKEPSFKKVYKAISPWFIKTPPGVSLFQFPMFFNFNQDWSVMPGVINTDMHYQINQQLIYTSDKKEIHIERGTPFVWYVPFVRKDFDYQINFADKEIQQEVDSQANAINTKFSGHYIKEMKKEELNNVS